MAIKKRKKTNEMDFILLIATILLTMIGLIMVFSASWPEGLSSKDFNNDGAYFVKRQMIFWVIGLIVMLVVSKINFKIYFQLEKLIYWTVVLLGASVLVIGVSLLGAKRWIEIGNFSFMPSDFMKIGTIIALSGFLTRNKRQIQYDFTTFLWSLALIGLPLGIIVVLQSDLGTGITLATVLIMLLYIGGVPFLTLFKTGLFGIGPLLLFSIISEPYRRERIKIAFNPFKDPKGDGYQIIQSLYAIALGGIVGSGIGQSKQKYFYLDFAYSDFIFAIIAEELGFIGVLIVLGIYGVIIWRGVKIALNVKDLFASYLAFGITGLIAVQTVVHIGTATAFAPPTGITMPFISYGGTSLVIFMGLIGILLNISRYTEIDRS